MDAGEQTTRDVCSDAALSTTRSDPELGELISRCRTGLDELSEARRSSSQPVPAPLPEVRLALDRLASFALAVLVCMALTGHVLLAPMSGASSRAGTARVTGVERFGFSKPASGRFLVTTVTTSGELADGDAQAMRRSQQDALIAASRCLGHAQVPDLALRTDGVGGPSAGLMFALTVIDLLTGADLTDGRRLAGTGAVGPDGAVLPVGSVAQKAKGAEDAGADLFLVPIENVEDARRATRHLEVKAVHSIGDALRSLSALGCASG